MYNIILSQKVQFIQLINNYYSLETQIYFQMGVGQGCIGLCILPEEKNTWNLVQKIWPNEKDIDLENVPFGTLICLIW